MVSTLNRRYYQPGEVHFVPERTKRKLIELAACRVRAGQAAEKAAAEVSTAEAELFACVADCDKLGPDVLASLELMREEEDRVKKGNSAVSKATEERKKIAEEFASYNRDKSKGWERLGPAPKSPECVVIPTPPDPISEEFVSKHNELMQKYIVLSCKLADADNAHARAVEKLRKKADEARAVGKMLFDQVEIYRKQKAEEDASRLEAEEYKRRIENEASISGASVPSK